MSHRLSAEETLSAKQALLVGRFAARRSAEPMGSHIKDLEAAIDRRKRALEEQATTAELEAELRAVQSRLQQAALDHKKIEDDIP